MTTNHRDRLDAALVRPGRVDLEQHFGLATSEQIRSMFLRFYPGHRGLVDHLAERVPAETLSPATLQGIFLQARDNPLQAVHAVLERAEARVLRFPVMAGV
jgi:chaperone BCS1